MSGAIDALKRKATQVSTQIQASLQASVEFERMTKDQQFQRTFGLDESEIVEMEIGCEFNLANSSAGSGYWTGKLYLSSKVCVPTFKYIHIYIGLTRLFFFFFFFFFLIF